MGGSIVESKHRLSVDKAVQVCSLISVCESEVLDNWIDTSTDGTYRKFQIHERAFGIGEQEVEGGWIVMATL